MIECPHFVGQRGGGRGWRAADVTARALRQAATLDTYVYKPFGTGERACIGRQFAYHESSSP
ncbi:cytochrome P450 [Nocardia amikacinitolerans]|uniref:cytochrome P450 n=1 Tax=Nocardia amikacinitolerans TaxID=756689 RepID=UPI0027E394FB|nr:cytochrome P450 [Nocardia amikacinitolerans]